MPEQSKVVYSKYQGEEIKTAYDKKICKLGGKITDNVRTKLRGVNSNDPEYWGLKEMLNEDIVDVALRMKLRKFYTWEELFKMNKKQFNAAKLQKILDDGSKIGIFEYDYGDNYDDNGPIKDAPVVKRWRVSFYVPGSAELFNAKKATIDEKPQIASFFERMTFLPLEHVTHMVRPGGNGIGMHVIPVEKAIELEPEALPIEKISYWMKKYEGHIAAGICSCRYSRRAIGEGCEDEADDWCIQFGDMADYAVECDKAHYITKEKALEIFAKAEKNGYVHQVTNIDGKTHIFDICNCNVKICNALRTALLYNTPNMERSAYTAKVTPEKCVACGLCVESCPAGAVKLGQKLCHKDGTAFEYPKQPLPDKIKWGKYAWDENYRDTIRMTDTYATGTAPCKVACPAHVPVQAYLRKAHEGKYEEALELIKTQNPFPAVCGRICNKRCEEACTRATLDAAVSIDAVKKFIAEKDLEKADRFIPEKIVTKVEGEFDEKIAIIGAGPAGLTAAYYLGVAGYHPVVFEKNAKAGGMMTYGIPSYKLEKDVIEAEVEVIKKLGVEIRTGVEVGKDITIADLKKEGFKTFYIAIGCQGGRRPGVANDEAEGTTIAVDYLRAAFENQDQKEVENVVVIGGGNVAVDCARTAKRFGAKNVGMYVLETRETMPASKEEQEETLAEDISINNQWGPKEVLVDENGHVSGIVLKKCVRTIDPETKRFSPVYDENDTITVKAEKIVFAIGQTIEWGKLLEGSKVTFWHGNYPVADKLTFQTADPDIFVGGDVYTGPKFVIDAIAAGHRVAESLIRHAREGAHPTIGLHRWNFTALNKEDIMIPSYDTCGRQEAGMDESIDYKHSFRDAHKTLTEEQVKKETARCLSCGASVVDPNRCIGCGICTTRCKFDAIHLVRDHPECSDMRVAEKKVTGLLSYALPRAFKILAHSGSAEAKMMAKKRKEYNKATKEFHKTHPHTGNAVPSDVNPTVFGMPQEKTESK